MSGLIMKDLCNFKQYAKQYLMMMGFFCVFAFGTKSPTYIVLMGIMMGMTYTFSSLTLDESGGYAFSLSLPVSRKQVIATKYLMLVLVMLVVIAISSILGAVIALWNKINFTEWIPSMLGAMAFFMLVMSILIPISVKYKVEKARIIFVGMVLVPTIFLFIIVKLIGSDKVDAFLNSDNLEQMLIGGLCVFVVISAICLLFSYFLSIKIFEKKEF